MTTLRSTCPETSEPPANHRSAMYLTPQSSVPALRKRSVQFILSADVMMKQPLPDATHKPFPYPIVSSQFDVAPDLLVLQLTPSADEAIVSDSPTAIKRPSPYATV